MYGYTSKKQGGAEFRCIEAATGKLEWSLKSKLGRGTALAADGKLFLLGEQGHLNLLVATPNRLNLLSATEKPLLDKPCYSSPALANGCLFLRDEQRVRCLNVAS